MGLLGLGSLEKAQNWEGKKPDHIKGSVREYEWTQLELFRSHVAVWVSSEHPSFPRLADHTNLDASASVRSKRSSLCFRL